MSQGAAARLPRLCKAGTLKMQPLVIFWGQKTGIQPLPRPQIVPRVVPGTPSRGESRAQMKGALPLKLTGELAAACLTSSRSYAEPGRDALCWHVSGFLWRLPAVKGPSSARHWCGSLGVLVRSVVGLHVPHLHKCTILPGCFNTDEIIRSSLAPFLKTAELLWQQFKNEKSASDRHST